MLSAASYLPCSVTNDEPMQVQIQPCSPGLAVSAQVGGARDGHVVGLHLEQADQQPVQPQH